MNETGDTPARRRFRDCAACGRAMYSTGELCGACRRKRRARERAAGAAGSGDEDAAPRTEGFRDWAERKLAETGGELFPPGKLRLERRRKPRAE